MKPFLIMIKKTIPIVLFLLTTLVSMSVKALDYPDYIITVKGDSIPCRITDRMFSEVIYIDSKKAIPEKMTWDLVKEFYLNDSNELYRAVYINNYKVPNRLQVIENGKISLYQILETSDSFHAATPTFNSYSTTHTATTWYVGKGSDHVKILKFNGLTFENTRAERKADFAKLLVDNKNVYDKFDAEDDFSFSGIQKIVHLYNTGEAYDGIYHGTEHYAGRNYIVTPKNDTIYCSIRNDYFTRKYMFKTGINDNFIAIDTLNTSEFFRARDTSHFVPVHVPGLPDKAFLKQVEKGSINLYQQAVISNDRDRKEIKSLWYINKGNGPLLLIASRAGRARRFELLYRHINDFFKAIGDNPGLLASSKKAFNAPDINTEELIRYYIKSYNSTYLTNNETGK